MYTLDLTGSKKSLKEVLKEHDVEISREIIESVCIAIDESLSKILVMQIIMDNETISMEASRFTYKSALEVNMKPLIEVEDYETCAKAKKYIDIISNKYLIQNY